MDKKEAINLQTSERATTIHEWSPTDESGRQKNSQEIEHDIEETRHSMDLILDALNGKANPGTLYKKAHDYFQSAENREKVKKSFSKVSNSVSNSFQRNPLPAMMIAAGASWMLWELNQPSHDGNTGEQLQQFKDESSQKIQTAKQKSEENVEALQGKAGEKIESAKQRAGTIASETKERAGAFFDQARHRADQYRDKASEVQSRASHTYKKADTTIHNNPLLFGFAAACAGIVAGLLLPETRTESRFAEETTPELKQKAEESASEISEIAKKIPEEGISSEKITRKEEKAKTISETGIDTKSSDIKSVNSVDNKAEP